MLQWNTAVSVTSARVLLLIQRQYVTSSGMVHALTLVLVSRLKICSDFAAAAAGELDEARGRRRAQRKPLRAMILATGFMMAESAEMGRRMGLLGSDMSTMTTCSASACRSAGGGRAHLRRLAGLLAHADELVGLQRERAEANARGIDSDACQLQMRGV